MVTLKAILTFLLPWFASGFSIITSGSKPLFRATQAQASSRTTLSFYKNPRLTRSVTISRPSICSMRMVQNENGDASDQLLSVLARIDSQQQQYQRNNRQGNSGAKWQKVLVTENSTKKSTNDESSDVMVSESTTSSTSETPNNNNKNNVSKDEYVYLYNPKGSKAPKNIILFLGGAGLGQYPHIAYSEFLSRLSLDGDTDDAVIITVPYSAGLDHFDLSKKTFETFRKALIYFQDKYDWNIFSEGDSSSEDNQEEKTKLYFLSHSLGAKLQLIGMAAMSDFFDSSEIECGGIGLISYNNFGFSDSLGMAKSFLSELSPSSSSASFGGVSQEQAFNTFFDFAKQAIDVVGIEFSPSPTQMQQLIEMKFASSTSGQNKNSLMEKMRVFSFSNDDLDCSDTLNLKDLTKSRLEGTHLTPVYLKFGVDDLEIPEEQKDIASQVANFESISFGNEDELNGLVKEVSNWINGKGSTSTVSGGNGRLISGIIDAEIE